MLHMVRTSKIKLGSNKEILLLQGYRSLDMKLLFIIIWINIHVNDKIRKTFFKSKRYRSLVVKLLFFTITTRPNKSFVVEVVSLFMQIPRDAHYNVVIHNNIYHKRGEGQGPLYEDKGNTQNNDIDHL